LLQAQIDELMAQEPPSTQGSSQGTIYWALNDPYSKVLGKEQFGRVRGVASVRIPRSSASTSRMPLGTCNDPEHAGIENFKKNVGLDFQRVFKRLDKMFLMPSVNSKHGL
jgi:hypothetical protein